jgi:quercetin dioxygenase-like cupin family protein
MPAHAPTVLLRSEQTAGEVAVIEIAVPAGWPGPPLHHHAFDEAFLVLEGELTFEVAGERRTAGPGALAFAPGGVHHALANHGDAPARYLLICTPGGFERYFDGSGPYPETTVVGGPVAAGSTPTGVPPVRPAVLLRAEESGGRVSVVANTVPAGAAGPYLHTHDFDEAFAILDGELVFQLGDELVTVRGGDVAFAPRGVPHTFTNRSEGAARIAIVCTPAGFERHFARLAAERAGEEPPAWALAPIPPVTRVGPRIGERA